jgi:hypothetical protein
VDSEATPLALVLMPVDADVESEPTALLVVDRPLDSDETPLALVLIPVEADVESEATLL